MTQIFHKITIEKPASEVYKAITDVEELKKWWTPDTTLTGEGVGSTFKFNFGPDFYNVMKVLELDENKKVLWEVIDNKGPTPEMDVWKGTKISYELEEKELERLQGKTVTILKFKHLDWQGEEDDFYADCNYHWAYYLTSLKKLVETGEALKWNN